MRFICWTCSSPHEKPKASLPVWTKLNSQRVDFINGRLSSSSKSSAKRPAAVRQLHPEIPWTQIIGMRHRLVHDYTNIDIPTVWSTTVRDLYPLIAALEPLVPPDRDLSSGQER